MTAGLNTEGNDPSLALERLQRGFPTPQPSPLVGPQSPLRLCCGVQSRLQRLLDPQAAVERYHLSLQNSGGETS